MIYRKLTEEELYLLEILEHPLWNPEFLRAELDPEWEHTSYQKEILLDCNSHVSFRAARAVGKSETLIDKVIYYAVNDFFSSSILSIVTPNRVHLNPLWRRLIRWLAIHPFLKNFQKSINSQTFTITLANGFTIDCRIAGVSGTGSTVIGLHTPVLVIDEAGFFPWPVWIELMPTLNTWETGYQLFICGTPSGQRENNVLYYADMESSQFNKHRVTAFDNPRYTEADDIRNREQYGSSSSDDYRRLVLGEHASPVELLFAREGITTENFQLFNATISSEQLDNDPLVLYRLFSSLPDKNQAKYLLSADLGFTDPTIIHIYEEIKPEVWKLIVRITLQHIDYPKQVEVIDRLDSIYNFYFLAIDEGNAGVAVSQSLLDAKFLSKNYLSRLIPINFGTTVSVGTNLDGEEIKVPLKTIAVEKLKEVMLHKRLIVSSRDDQLLSELERVEAYRSEAANRVLYRVRALGGGVSKDDHIFASLLCFSFALYSKEDQYRESTANVKLFSARWARQ